MSPIKRDDIRTARRWSVPEQAPASRRGRANWTVRWIGAAKRRSSKAIKAIAVDAPSACIIQLSCADTFGRPVRIEPAGIFRSAGTILRLTPL